MTRPAAAVLALLAIQMVGCAPDREIHVNQLAPGSSLTLRRHTTNAIRAGVVELDGDGWVEAVHDDCVEGRSSNPATVELVPQDGKCQEFFAIARSRGMAVLTFSSGELSSEIRVLVLP
jgi:hypothetical protein